MHVHPLSIASVSVQSRRNNYQLLLGNKVPNASLVPGGVALGHGMQVEFEGRGEGEKSKQHAAD